MKLCFIYVIRNLLNDKVYIGQTWQSLRQRFYEHKSRQSSIKLKRAINKYGFNNFSITPLVSCDSQLSADAMEKFWITVFNSVNEGYNIKEGGSNGRHNQETKDKLSRVIKVTKINWPPIEELKRLSLELGYLELGRRLGVSDNAIRKRIRNHS